ncbi:MAG: DUF4266 domain-containing protein [Polyangiaceae bacterium]
MRRARQLILCACTIVLAACTHVAPYERGVIARPDMAPGDISGPAAQHVEAVHEGATRSGSVAETGCGCN